MPNLICDDYTFELDLSVGTALPNYSIEEVLATEVPKPSNKNTATLSVNELVFSRNTPQSAGVFLTTNTSLQLMSAKINKALAVISDITAARQKLAPELMSVLVLCGLISSETSTSVLGAIHRVQNSRLSTNDLRRGYISDPARKVFATLVFPYSKKRNKILAAKYVIDTAIETQSSAVLMLENISAIDFIFSEAFNNLNDDINSILNGDVKQIKDYFTDANR